jgi:hypothetical protein
LDADAGVRNRKLNRLPLRSHHELDLSLADDKRRPDGTHLFRARRPRLYQAITEPALAPVCHGAAQRVSVGLLAPRARDESALGELQGLVAGLPPAAVLAVLPPRPR